MQGNTVKSHGVGQYRFGRYRYYRIGIPVVGHGPGHPLHHEDHVSLGEGGQQQVS